MKTFTSQQEMIEAFQVLYQEHYGIELSDDDAMTEGMRLVNFVRYMNPELDTMKQQNHA